MGLERLLKPRSIAVFGGAMAQEVIRQSDRMGYQGELWPVHPSKQDVVGRTAFRSVQDLPGSPDAAYVGVNRHLTVEIVRELAARDAGGAICFATGFSEAGAEGAELEQRLLEASGEMHLLGPNCYGLLNYLDGAMLWPDQQGGRRVEEGVAIITMSSNVAFNLTMQRRGLPIAYVMSLGNALKFDLHDAIRVLAEEPRVTALGLYVESISDPRAFERAVADARSLAKPVVAIKAGRSETGQRIVLSHSASLAGSDALIGALFDRIGVARVDSMEALMEALKVLHVLGPLEGGRVGAMSTSGGDLCMLGDALMGTPRLALPPLSSEAAERVRATVHERIAVANPLDYQMFDWNNEERLAATFAAFIADDFDVSLCLLDFPRDDRCDGSSWGGAERGFVRASRAAGANAGVLSTFTDTMPEQVADRLIAAGVVPLSGIHNGLAGIQAAVDVGAAWKRPPPPPLLAASEVGDGPVRVLDEAESKAALARYGVPVPAGRVVASRPEAVRAAEELGLPVAVKALGVDHKTEVGAVRLGMTSLSAVEQAVAGMAGLAESFLIERMVDGVVAELIVGVARDEQLGPHVIVGGGGVLVELMRDSRPLLLPVTREQVLASLSSLRCAPLLRGFRGAPPADLEAAADVVLAVAVFAEQHHPPVIEVDINPLLVLASGHGAVAADALISVRVDGERAGENGRWLIGSPGLGP
jgi:acyl-CoA synthetase (NDP forming)